MFATNQFVRFGFLAAILMGLGAGWAAADDNHPLIGFRAPNLKGEFAVNGEPTTIRELKGKVVLVYFWAPWSPQCQGTSPHIQSWQKKYGNKLAVVGVTTYYKGLDFDDESGKMVPVAGFNAEKNTGGLSVQQENKMIARFAKKFRLKQLLMTVSKADWDKAEKAYNFSNLPAVYILDRAGVVRLVRVGATAEDIIDVGGELRNLLSN